MMEYTLARMVAVVCGVVLLAAVLPPVTSVFDDGQSEGMQQQSETLCRMLDSFHESEAEEMTICLNTVLPQNSSVMMDGYFVTIVNDEDQYRYNTEYTMRSEKEVYTSNDYIRITKNVDSLIIETL